MKNPIRVTIVLISVFVISANPGASQTTFAQDATVDVAPTLVRFRFAGAPWRSVLQWLAETGEYALHINDLPLGSFTYSDEKSYTLDEAINRINLFLIPKRYTLVRSERLLSVISLDDETSVRQLESMARIVSPAELDGLGSHELVKCFFPLGSISQDHALEELSSLMLLREPNVLSKTNQLLVLDTAAKLRMVLSVLNSLAHPNAAFGPVKKFPLGDLDPEKALAQVRPHVGLDPLAMIGADIRLSVDRDRRQLLASGSSENLGAVATVLALLQDTNEQTIVGDELVFRTHDVGDANIQTVDNVLQTLLAEEDVRLNADAVSNQLAVLANEKVHALVNKTIQDLSSTHNLIEFKVFEVDSIDARYAALVLNDMYASHRDSSDESTVSHDSPRIDADSYSGRLFIRARKSQLKEIERAIEQISLESPQTESNLRLLPYHGEKTNSLLDSARRLWPHKNRIEVIPPNHDPPRGESLEREINSAVPKEAFQGGNERGIELIKYSLTDSFSNETDGQSSGSVPKKKFESNAPAAIHVRPTREGLLVHCDDASAVERFAEHLELISGTKYRKPGRQTNRQLAVFYLKHAKIDDANALLRQLLDDESWSKDGYPAGLARLALTARGTEPLEGFASAWGYDATTVIPDSRLNRLFVYGTREDLDAIEAHLQVIDRENSIADVRTHGTPRVIRFEHAEAEDVAAVIRDTYSGRIALSEKDRRTAEAAQRPPRANEQGGNQFDPKPNTSQAQNGDAETDEGKMTLAVDAKSNTIVVTAPSQLADEVERLAQTIDRDSEHVVQVIPLTGIETLPLRTSLKDLFGDHLQTGDPQPLKSSAQRAAR